MNESNRIRQEKRLIMPCVYATDAGLQCGEQHIFSMTVFSGSSPNCSTMRFRIVDFPALVYPTSATCGVRDCCLFLRCTSRVLLTSSSSFFSSVIRCSILRLSSSSFFSPVPCYSCCRWRRPDGSVHRTCPPVSEACIAISLSPPAVWLLWSVHVWQICQGSDSYDQ